MNLICGVEGDPFSDDIEEKYRFHNAVPLSLLNAPTEEAAEAAAKLSGESYNPRIKALTDWVKAGFDYFFKENDAQAAHRRGYCIDGGALTVYAARSIGQKAYAYQVENVHKKVGLPFGEASHHVFAVVEEEKRYYAIDDTFTQFVQLPKGDLVRKNIEEPLGKSIYTPENFPLVNQLFREGYFLITPDNLMSYLNLTTSAPFERVKACQGAMEPSIFGWSFFGNHVDPAPVAIPLSHKHYLKATRPK